MSEQQEEHAGCISDEMVAEMREIFDNLDKDKSGYLEFPEVKTLLQGIGQNPTDKDIENLIAAAEEHGLVDKKIDFHEFLAVMNKDASRIRTKEEENEELKAAFKMFDKDDNGFISSDELLRVLTNLGCDQYTEDDAKAMIAECDADMDGRIDYTEFCNKLSGIIL